MECIKGRGFTIVELVVVLVLLGILSAVAIGHFTDNQSFDVPSHADRVRALLRYGQKVAVAQNRPVYVDLSSTEVTLCFDDSCTSKVQSPSLQNDGSDETIAACASVSWACLAPPTGITVATTAAEFTYDAQGKPYADGEAVTGVSTFAKLTVTVSGATASQQLFVETDTGYVY